MPSDLPAAALHSLSGVADSPYDQSRAARAPYGETAKEPPDPDWDSPYLPNAAIFGNIPTPNDYATAAPESPPILLIAIAFHKMYKSPGKLRDAAKGMTLKGQRGYKNLEGKKLQDFVYVNSANYDLSQYVIDNPEGGPSKILDQAKFLKLLLNRYRTYEGPRPFDFCAPDPAQARSRKMIDSLVNQDRWSVVTEDGKATEIVKTLTDVMWRKDADDGAYLEAWLLTVPAIEMCYAFSESGFSEVFLEPPERQTAKDYFKNRQKALLDLLEQYNSILNIFHNYGDQAGGKGKSVPLHPDYLKMLEKVRVEIGGHTDRMGEAAKPGEMPKFDNRKLSLARADGIVAHLNSPAAGNLPNLVAGRLSAAGYGADECTPPVGGGEPQKDRGCRKVSVRLAWK